jgi:hypothetical protein
MIHFAPDKPKISDESKQQNLKIAHWKPIAISDLSVTFDDVTEQNCSLETNHQQWPLSDVTEFEFSFWLSFFCPGYLFVGQNNEEWKCDLWIKNWNFKFLLFFFDLVFELKGFGLHTVLECWTSRIEGVGISRKPVYELAVSWVWRYGFIVTPPLVLTEYEGGLTVLQCTCCTSRLAVGKFAVRLDGPVKGTGDWCTAQYAVYLLVYHSVQCLSVCVRDSSVQCAAQRRRYFLGGEYFAE